MEFAAHLATRCYACPDVQPMGSETEALLSAHKLLSLHMAAQNYRSEALKHNTSACSDLLLRLSAHISFCSYIWLHRITGLSTHTLVLATTFSLLSSLFSLLFSLFSLLSSLFSLLSSLFVLISSLLSLRSSRTQNYRPELLCIRLLYIMHMDLRRCQKRGMLL